MQVDRVSPAPSLDPGSMLQFAANETAAELAAQNIVLRATLKAHERAYVDLAEKYNELAEMFEAVVTTETLPPMPEEQGDRDV